MSNIPLAREILTLARRADDVKFIHKQIDRALAVLDRAKPDFIARVEHAPVTKQQEVEILRLRAQGMSLQKISQAVQTQLGRVSEVVNGKRKGV